jgi:hypothetical protein
MTQSSIFSRVTEYESISKNKTNLRNQMGYNRFPVNGVDYFFVVLYALFFPVIPVVSFYLIIRLYKKTD